MVGIFLVNRLVHLSEGSLSEGFLSDIILFLESLEALTTSNDRSMLALLLVNVVLFATSSGFSPSSILLCGLWTHTVTHLAPLILNTLTNLFI